MDLKDAPKAVQLAVDLIYLLESHHIDPQTVLEALDIVRQDYEKKEAHQSANSTLNKSK